MLLALDIGNTNIVIGYIDNGNVLSTVRMHTDTRETAAEYAIKIKQIIDLHGMRPEQFDGAIVSSVVPQINEAVKNAVKSVLGFSPILLGPGVRTGMNVRIDDPGTLGADFVCGGVAVIAYYSTPAIVVDMGTATTITIVDRSNSFRGGAILPGVYLSYNALAAGTSLLPDIAITPPKKCIGTNTVDCMRSGAVYGTAAMIDGMIDRLEEELGEKCTVIATGGLAPYVVPCCRHEITVDDELLLKGLWVIYNKNK